MDDKQIIKLFQQRSENAISETSKKYGAYCHYIAYHILLNHQDSEECVNDTYLKAWNTIPPTIPDYLSAFLARITRSISINRMEQQSAQKRGGNQVILSLEELEECVPSENQIDKLTEDSVLDETINRFLRSLSADARLIFLRRYWYFCTVKEIASDLKISEGKVKMSLYRTRKKLYSILTKEGIVL